VLRDVFLGAAQRRPHCAERVRVERRQVERRAGEARVVGGAGQPGDELVDDGRLDRLGHDVRRPSRGGIGSSWVWCLASARAQPLDHLVDDDMADRAQQVHFAAERRCVTSRRRNSGRNRAIDEFLAGDRRNCMKNRVIAQFLFPICPATCPATECTRHRCPAVP
jgi:hypothetical protein